ncbi:hypothetical protein LCGC14_2043330 [marine sediment metagenome]|uniref:Uncharacterized protein n=1 Tax=marine sediment metagenome TaxID=412755 RepID=A0A0F9FDR2_9ZZZZ
MLKRPKRSKIYMDTLKDKFKEKCCFKDIAFSTKEIFEIMGFNYSNVDDRQFLYRCISKWTKSTIKKFWKSKPINNKEREIYYTAFLEKCWLEKEPFGYFTDGMFQTPRTYGQYEAILNKYAIRSLVGYTTTISAMANKNMLINGKIPAELLLSQANILLKSLEISENDLLEYNNNETE